MADVKLLKYDGTEQQYPGVDRVQLATVGGGTAIFSYGEAVEGIEISPDFSAGDMPVDAPAGTLVKSAVIVKPENLTPENVRKGVNVAGIEGNMIGDTEEVTVPLNMPEGDQIILPASEGKVLSKVTVTKPETMIPENIRGGVEIGGVTGSFEPPEPVTAEITLDFSEGTMEVVPDNETVFDRVLIPVPENLIPENISEGINIAGVIGSMAAGGGSKAVVAEGTVKGNSSYITISHGLGVVPDIIMIHTDATTTSVGRYLISATGLSKDFRNIVKNVSSFMLQRYAYYNNGTKYAGSTNNYTTSTTKTLPINNTNKNSFTIGGNVTNAYKTLSADYYWIAIGGLS